MAIKQQLIIGTANFLLCIQNGRWLVRTVADGHYNSSKQVKFLFKKISLREEYIINIVFANVLIRVSLRKFYVYYAQFLHIAHNYFAAIYASVLVLYNLIFLIKCI